jgi:hypothetical protein
MDHDEFLTSPQTAHLRSASQQSFSSARVLFSTICPFGGLSCWVQSLAVKVLVSSTKKDSRHAFGFASLAFEPVTSTNSSAKAATGVQASAVKNKTNDFRQGATSHFYDDHLRRLIVEYQTEISLHFVKDFTIFCEGERRRHINANDRNDENKDEIVRQGLNLPSSASISFSGISGLVDRISIITSDSSQPTSHESSCASLLAARTKCLNQNESSCASLLAARAKCLNHNESSCASLLAARAKCLSHKSGCASLLARAKNLRNSSRNKLWWIVEYIFWNSSRDKLQLIVKSSNNDRFEGAFIGSFSDKFHNLIVGFIQKFQSRLQKDLVDLSLSNAFLTAKLDSISIKAKSNSAMLIDLPTSQQKAMIFFYDGSS